MSSMEESVFVMFLHAFIQVIPLIHHKFVYAEQGNSDKHVCDLALNSRQWELRTTKQHNFLSLVKSV